MIDSKVRNMNHYCQKCPFSGARKWTSSARIKKRRPLFHANTPPKWWTRYLFHVFTSKSDFWPFYWFWIFWLRFQLFLHCKNPQNWNGQQTIVYGSINLKFFLGGPDTYTKLPCEERSPNPNFFFWPRLMLTLQNFKCMNDRLQRVLEARGAFKSNFWKNLGFCPNQVDPS